MVVYVLGQGHKGPKLRVNARKLLGDGVGSHHAECRMTTQVLENPWQKGKTRDQADAQGRGVRKAISPERATRRWGVILAGGDGVRLRGLTRLICGDDRPKQFCPMLGKRTLLQEARQRAERSICHDQILYSLTQVHQNHYLSDLGDRPSQRIVQPSNKGTAPAILYALLHISQLEPDAIVAVLPCDHYYSRENVFTAALESAFAIAETQHESIVLLGARPKAPEVEYGWIELGEKVAGPYPGVFQVKGFQEKPALPVAQHLLRSGSLWNTFVMVGRVQAFLDLASASVPGLLRVLRSGFVFAAPDSETRVAEWLYDQIEPADFSRQVLSPGTGRLVTLSLGDIEWNDLGDPHRVVSTLIERGWDLPRWAKRWRAEPEPKRSSTERVSVAVA